MDCIHLDPGVLGHLIYERRLALDLPLLLVSRRSGVSLLALCDLERGAGQVPGASELERLGHVLGLPWLHRTAWRVQAP